MKVLLLVLTAFFLQSCYTMLYTPSEYSATGDTPYCPPSGPVFVDPRPPRPYIPAPPPDIQIHANIPADQPDARPRNDAAAGNSNNLNTPSENPARLRTPAQQAADNNTQPARTEPRERTTPQTQQNDTPRPRSR